MSAFWIVRQKTHTNLSTTGSSVLKAEAILAKKAPKAAPVSAARCTRTSIPLTVACVPGQPEARNQRERCLTLSFAEGPAERSTAMMALRISAMSAYFDF